MSLESGQQDKHPQNMGTYLDYNNYIIVVSTYIAPFYHAESMFH